MISKEHSILTKVSVDDIYAIRDDFYLLEQKVKIFYVVDTYDVIEFCFPTLTNNINDSIEGSIASSFFAYNFFFFYNQSKPVILDEYKIELFGIWNEIHRETNDLLNQRSKEDIIEAIKNKLQKDKENLGRNIGLLLSLSLGFLTDSSLLRYKKVINNRLQIEHFETENADDRMIIEEIFSKTPASERIFDLFNDFCDDARLVISGKTEKEKYAYLENAYRDIVVFDRVIRINEAIQEQKNLKEKYVFLYLSSTPNKSSRIANLFKKANLSPSIFGTENYSIHRNIGQYYLSELIQGSTSGEHGSSQFKQKQLDTCLAILKENDQRDKLVEKVASSLSVEMAIFNKKININGNELENTYLLCHSYYAYRDRILKAVESNGHLFDLEMKTIVEDLFTELDKNKNENDRLLLTLNNYKDEFTVQSKILRYLRAVKNHKNIIKLVPGRDPIRSIVQLYPILLFYPNLGKQTYIPLLNFFTYVFRSHILDVETKSDKFINLKRMDVFHLDSYERRLYYLFLDLIIPDDHPLETFKTNEKELINELRKLYAINSKRNTEIKVADNKETVNVFLFPQKDFEIEVVYFLSWLYRRDRNYEAAIKLLNNIIEKYDVTDPRLLHSKALCLISKVYENLEINPSSNFELIVDALTYLKQSLNIFEKDYDQTPGILLKHIIITIKNAQCDLQTKLFDIDQKQFAKMIINEARPTLNSFKKDLKDLQEDYFNYPTYNHTEVDLEYCEAVIAFMENEVGEAKWKITCAKSRFDLIVEAEALKNYIYLNYTKRKITNLHQMLFNNF